MAKNRTPALQSIDKDNAMQQYDSGGALVKTSAYTPAGNGGIAVYFSCDDCAEQIALTG